MHWTGGRVRLNIFQIAAQARTAAEAHQITYIDFLTVTLTALCAMLAILAIIIAVAAIWGYIGIKEEILESVEKKADTALQAKLNEYPDSKAVFDLFEQMREMHERQKALSNQLVKETEAQPPSQASKNVDDKERRRGVSLARDYPGKGKQ